MTLGQRYLEQRSLELGFDTELSEVFFAKLGQLGEAKKVAYIVDVVLRDETVPSILDLTDKGVYFKNRAESWRM